MSEAVIPLALLILGIAAVLWQVIKADRQRTDGTASSDDSAAPTRAQNGREKNHGDQSR